MSKLAWKNIDWVLVQKRLSRQQRRVYKASMEGKRSTVHALQRRIIGSLDAKLLAVRQLTIENSELKIFGGNGMITLSHEEKIKLAFKLKLDGKTSNIKRVYINKVRVKKNIDQTLNISIIENRAKQMLVKLALEPEWEAIFEPNSYGFRPGRSCHDTIASISLLLRGKSRFVLGADIHKCFDKIDHDKLIAKLDTFDQIENQINSWLKADIMVDFVKETNEVTKSFNGTFQSGILSPLLVNIALHGLGNYIKDLYSTSGYNNSKSKRDRSNPISFSRYGCNFVFIVQNLGDLQEIEKQVGQWLMKKVGLKLSNAKLRIVSSTSGFEFLGFQIISIRTIDNKKEKVKIIPSKESRARILDRIRSIIQSNKAASSYLLIIKLSSKILGWAKYFQYSECLEIFSKIDYAIYGQVRAWVFRRKSKGLRSRMKLKEKYFPSGNTYTFRRKNYKNNWVLTGQILGKSRKIKQNYLPKISWLSSTQHIKVKGNASTFDGHNVYWSLRTGWYLGFSTKIENLIRRQGGHWVICEEPFIPTGIIEADHLIL
jgi:RNA-directed DNA polymerase